MEGSRADAIKYLLVYKEMRTNSVFCGSLSKLHDMCGLFRFQQPHLSLREKKLCYKCGDFTVVPVQLTGSRFYYYLLDFKMSGIHSTISQCKLKGKNKSCTRPVVQICTKKWMGSSLLGHTTHFHQSYMNQVSRGLFFLVTLLTNRQTHQTENIPSLAEVRITYHQTTRCQYEGKIKQALHNKVFIHIHVQIFIQTSDKNV